MIALQIVLGDQNLQEVDLWKSVLAARQILREAEQKNLDIEKRMREGIPSLEALLGDPEALERDKQLREQQDRARIREQGFLRDRGLNGWSSLYLSAADFREIETKPMVYFRRILAQAHLPTGDRSTINARLQEGMRYFNDLYIED